MHAYLKHFGTEINILNKNKSPFSVIEMRAKNAPHATLGYLTDLVSIYRKYSNYQLIYGQPYISIALLHVLIIRVLISWTRNKGL
ncbi:hypothetical protein ACJX0J_012856, partial [Zea mays]